MGQELVKRWDTAHLAFNKLRIGGDRPTPDKTATEILAEEVAAWEALNHALPQASRVEATGLRVEALAAQNLEVGEDTNTRLELLQRQVDEMGAQTKEMHGLLIKHTFTAGSSPETTAAQADTMIASLKQVKAAAKTATKAEAEEAKTKLAAAKAEAKTNAAAAKEEAKTNAAAAKEAAKEEAKTKAAAAKETKAKAKAAAKRDAIRQIIRNR
jgi:histone H1/5